MNKAATLLALLLALEPASYSGEPPFERRTIFRGNSGCVTAFETLHETEHLVHERLDWVCGHSSRLKAFNNAMLGAQVFDCLLPSPLLKGKLDGNLPDLLPVLVGAVPVSNHSADDGREDAAHSPRNSASLGQVPGADRHVLRLRISDDVGWLGGLILFGFSGGLAGALAYWLTGWLIRLVLGEPDYWHQNQKKREFHRDHDGIANAHKIKVNAPESVPYSPHAPTPQGQQPEGRRTGVQDHEDSPASGRGFTRERGIEAPATRGEGQCSEAQVSARRTDGDKRSVDTMEGGGS